MSKYLPMLVVAAAVLATPVLAKPADGVQSVAAKPVVVAKTVMKSLSLKPAGPALFGPAGQTRIEVYQAGAQFVKVHFKRFYLPEGAYVTVADPQGRESYRYDGVDNRQATFDVSTGESGLNRFSAMSVFGDTAIVTLVVPQGVRWMPQHSIEIDRVNAGIDEAAVAKQQAQFSTCGAMERKDVACWQDTHPRQFERTRPVARLLMSGTGLCTGWRVSDDNRMFTNNHCVATAGEVQNTEVWFNYQYTSCGGNTLAGTVKVTGRDLLKTDYDLDYALFTVNDFATIAGFGNFGLAPRTPQQGELIYIPQHGVGNPKEMAIESDQNNNGLCQIDIASVDGRAAQSDTAYLCDTIGGSSGSPVLADNSDRVIALHHFGGCENQGVQIGQIWPQVSEFFGGVVPQGDNGSSGNRAPVAQIDVSCNALDCTFDGTSSADPDGSIVDYSWSLGDGSSSSGQQVSHVFANSGSYSVTLTVTDDKGATGSATRDVSVSDNSSNELQSGVALSGLAADKDAELVYFIKTTADNQKVTVTISGGTGDADLYVKNGAVPTTSDYDCRPYVSGNNETCTQMVGTSGSSEFVKLVGYSAFGSVQLVATLSDAGDSGYPKTNLSGSKGNWDRYVYPVSASGTLTVSIAGGSGDADLYVQKAAEPTTTIYDCRPYKSGNNESCEVSVVEGDSVHIGIRAYNDYSGLTLDVQ